MHKEPVEVLVLDFLTFLQASLVTQMVWNLPAMQVTL